MAGCMAGCSSQQLLLRVLLPAARMHGGWLLMAACGCVPLRAAATALRQRCQATRLLLADHAVAATGLSHRCWRSSSSGAGRSAVCLLLPPAP
eukprot:COSAG01_NODE_489_length_16370_cov_7.973818_10_plen_93_part_00